MDLCIFTTTMKRRMLNSTAMILMVPHSCVFLCRGNLKMMAGFVLVSLQTNPYKGTLKKHTIYIYIYTCACVYVYTCTLKIITLKWVVALPR